MNGSIIILEVFIEEKRKLHWENAEKRFNEAFNFRWINSSDEIKQFIDTIASVVELPLIVFGHNSDIVDLERRTKIINACKKKKIPIVLFSGGSNKGYNIDDLLLEDLHVDVLAENIISFLDHLNKNNTITGDDWGTLVEVDPELENLLLPFETLSPTANSNDIVILKNGNLTEHKTIGEVDKLLNDYVQKKIINKKV